MSTKCTNTLWLSLNFSDRGMPVLSELSHFLQLVFSLALHILPRVALLSVDWAAPVSVSLASSLLPHAGSWLRRARLVPQPSVSLPAKIFTLIVIGPHLGILSELNDTTTHFPVEWLKF